MKQVYQPLDMDLFIFNRYLKRSATCRDICIPWNLADIRMT